MGTRWGEEAAAARKARGSDWGEAAATGAGGDVARREGGKGGRGRSCRPHQRWGRHVGDTGSRWGEEAAATRKARGSGWGEVAVAGAGEGRGRICRPLQRWGRHVGEAETAASDAGNTSPSTPPPPPPGPSPSPPPRPTSSPASSPLPPPPPSSPPSSSSRVGPLPCRHLPDDDPDSGFAPDDPDLLCNCPVPDRLLVVSAGVAANLLFAFLIVYALARPPPPLSSPASSAADGEGGEKGERERGREEEEGLEREDDIWAPYVSGSYNIFFV
uniref:Uncharacterized protein n=1 Tax=Oryza sativa subsp. japonica TaxID=39947 RepID=Q6Z3B4_ORYSJ|nr:hypothetical protein [Oryza sativa Japonica Group]